MTSAWTVLVLAGQRPGEDPLAKHFGIEWKALVPVAGEAMLTRVVRTLRTCPEVANIVVLTQSPEAFRQALADGGGVDGLFESRDSIALSILSAIDALPLNWPLLVTTADHVLLTREIVANFLEGATEADLAVAMVESTNFLKQFPTNRRTWLKFADGSWSGANLFALTNPRARAALHLWIKAEQDRKRPWKLFHHFGPWLFLRAITRSIGLKTALSTAGNRLGMTAKLVALDDPVAAIDVDKPADHELATKILRERSLA